MKYKQLDINIPAFRKWLMRRNAIIAELMSPDEVLRFSTTRGFGVIQKLGRGGYQANGVADIALRCFRRKNNGWTGGHNVEAIATQRVYRSTKDRDKILEKLEERDGERACAYCGKPLAEGEATLEHVIPLSRGGPDNLSNMVIACLECNAEMGNAPIIEKLKKLRSGTMYKYGVEAEELSEEAKGAAEVKGEDVDGKGDAVDTSKEEEDAVISKKP